MDESAERLQAAVRLRRGQPARVGTRTLLPVRGAEVRKGDVILAEVEKRLVLGRVTDVLPQTGDIRLGIAGWTTWGCVFGRQVSG